MSASFVLASLRGSTYRSVRLASSLAAAALDGHFEHPAARKPRETGGTSETGNGSMFEVFGTSNPEH